MPGKSPNMFQCLAIFGRQVIERLARHRVDEHLKQKAISIMKTTKIFGMGAAGDKPISRSRSGSDTLRRMSTFDIVMGNGKSKWALPNFLHFRRRLAPVADSKRPSICASDPMQQLEDDSHTEELARQVEKRPFKSLLTPFPSLMGCQLMKVHNVL